MTSLGVFLAILFTIGWLPSYVFRVESLADALPRYTPVERRTVRIAPLILAMHMTIACITLNLLPDIPLWAAAAGVLTFAAALGIWFWGRVMIGPLRQRRLPDEPPLVFHRDGAFGIVRNPLYCGYLLATLAPVIVARRGYLLITFGLVALTLAVLALQEERRLRAQLGPQYDAYCREVKRLLPFVW